MWIIRPSVIAANDAALVEVHGPTKVTPRQQSFLASRPPHVSAKPSAEAFGQAVDLLIAYESARLARSEITQQSFQITSQRARGEIAAHFKNTPIQRIDRAAIERFVGHLSSTGVRASTIKAYLVVLRKLLTCCLHQEWIDRVPAFPTVKAPTNPRGHFTVVEYLRLLRAAKQLRSVYTEPPTRASSHRSTRGGIFTATEGVPWAVPGFKDTLLRCFLELEVLDGTAQEFFEGVQA